MRRLLLALCLLLPLPAAALDGGRPWGFTLRLETGWVLWNLDGDRLRAQVGDDAPNVDSQLVNQTSNALGLILAAGYNILGHATVAAEFTATGWSLGNNDRGGAGFIAGTAAWHPFGLVTQLQPSSRDALEDFDASLFFGMGYGVLGENRALTGFHYEYGLRGEYFVLDSLSVGAALRVYPLKFGNYVLNWDAEAKQELPKGSGGSVIIPALSLSWRP